MLYETIEMKSLQGAIVYSKETTGTVLSAQLTFRFEEVRLGEKDIDLV